MLGVANVYLNRYYSHWGGSRSLGTEGFKQAIMDARTPISQRTRGDYYTNRDLYSNYENTSSNILKGPANDAKGNCAVLIFSFQCAANIIAKHFGIGCHLVPGMRICNNVSDSLYFHSFNQEPPAGHWGWDGPLDYHYTYWTPRYGGGYRPFHFFTKRGVVCQGDRSIGLWLCCQFCHLPQWC